MQQNVNLNVNEPGHCVNGKCSQVVQFVLQMSNHLRNLVSLNVRTIGGLLSDLLQFELTAQLDDTLSKFKKNKSIFYYIQFLYLNPSICQLGISCSLPTWRWCFRNWIPRLHNGHSGLSLNFGKSRF